MEINENRLNAPQDVNNDDNDRDVFDNNVVRDGVDISAFNHNKSGMNNYMPHNGMEFETKEIAYSFYREYARSIGFGITIKASRRSKKSGNFIDIKIACSRFGNKRHSSTIISPRSCPKTDCKASLHIKRRADGKWFIYSFVDEHNHEICPDDFYNSLRGKNKQNLDLICLKKGLQLALSERDVQLLLDYFMLMQAEAPGFYYVIDFAKEGYMRNVFWVDPKGRHDYVFFNDVVFFDTHYVRSKYNIPFVPIIGVNNHFQFILLGCAIIGDEKPSTFLWLMRAWLRSVGGQCPKVIITDNNKSLNEAAYDVFPNASLCFSYWHVFRDIVSNLSHTLSEFDVFLQKFRKCIDRSWTNLEFEKRWQKMVKKFDLTDDKWIQALYEDRSKWVRTYMRDIFLGGFCTVDRSKSVASFFDKYLQKEITIEEFIDNYKLFLHENCEEEDKADIETHHSQPTLISHSPFEKQMCGVYTDTVFKKFQAEVSGIHACNVEKEGEDNKTVLYRVDDLEIKQNFIVTWNQDKYEICCLCHLFEYSGFLCRHALSVLQVCGVSTIPSNYILKRWTIKAKIRDNNPRASTNTNLRVQRFDDLCKLAVKLCEEGSLSGAVYEVACHALEEALIHSVLETNIVKASKTKEVPKKRKVQAEAETGIMVEEVGSRIHAGSNPLSSMWDTYYPTSQGDMGNLNAASAHFSHQKSLQGLEISRSMTSKHMHE